MNRLFLVIIVVLMSAPARADAPEQLSHCTHAQQTTMAALLNTPDFTRFFTRYQSMLTARNALKGEAILVIRDDEVRALADFQQFWWGSVFDAMPACAESFQFSIALGRGLDEQYIGFLLVKAGDYDAAGPHLQAGRELMARIPDILGASS